MNQHGSIQLAWQDGLLTMHTTGPFNEEGIDQAFLELRTNVSEANLPRWYRIDILDKETYGSPQVMSVISQSYLWAMTHGCQAIAIVCANRLQEQLLEQFTTRTHINLQSFLTAADALAWLDSQRFGNEKDVFSNSLSA